MGKTKGNRVKRRSANPTGIPSVKELEECEELICVNFETGTVESAIEKLQSRKAEDRECAAFTIANMACNSSFVASLIENKVIRIAAPLLLDRNLSIRHAVAGCLRNLAAYGDHSVCQAMVDQDILTSLVALLLEYKEHWSPVKSPENKIDSKSEIFLEACNLLWSLCESSDTAVAVFNKKRLISVLLPRLDVVAYGLQVPLAVAQCLHTVAEENPEVIEELSQPLIQEQLKALMSLKPVEPEHVLLKTLAAGIMLNVASGKLHNSLNETTTAVIEVIASTLEEPFVQGLCLLAEQITSHKQERLDKYSEEKAVEEKLNAVTNTTKTLDYLLQSKQISLEILANICFGDDPNDEWDDVSSSDTNEEVDMEIETETPVLPLKLGLGVSGEIHSIIIHLKLLEKVVNQIVIPPEEILKVISENAQASGIIKRLNTVRCRALLCLNNLIQGLDMEEIGGPTKLFELWMNVANMLFKKTDTSNTEQLEAATTSMRAVLQKLAESKCTYQFSNLNESDLELLMNICQQCQDASIRVNIIRILGTIGCLLGKPDLFNTSQKLINVIGMFLLDICAKSSDLWVTAETLDVIFDVFAEDHVDCVAQEIGLVDKLTHMLPTLKGKVKHQRKFLGEHLPVIMTAKENLTRFIKYKNSQNKK